MFKTIKNKLFPKKYTLEKVLELSSLARKDGYAEGYLQGIDNIPDIAVSVVRQLVEKKIVITDKGGAGQCLKIKADIYDDDSFKKLVTDHLNIQAIRTKMRFKKHN